MSLDWTELIRALGLVMVIEGLMPFAAPSQWRRMLLTLAQMEARSLRLIGFLSLCGGLLLLNLA
ncbi:DUF2065 domain-containing protein [Fontimonas sp. SYSU GA230001]|uniref:DUF2065 domain-containing protein n=1 Tax=Fontimonas sp. SYSU GA230001 TaxID=3142450 RepID=UPI0032B3288F